MTRGPDAPSRPNRFKSLRKPGLLVGPFRVLNK